MGFSHCFIVRERGNTSKGVFSFQNNPVLSETSEKYIIGSKGETMGG